MPQFAPSTTQSAKAPITVKPAGLSCETELYLVSGTTKVVTSGVKPFTSTGVAQDIAFPITMPSTTGTYKVYLDIFASGILIGAYQATEDVVIISPAIAIVVTTDLITVMGLSLDKLEYWNPATATYQLTCPAIAVGQIEGVRATIGEWLVQKGTTWPAYGNCWEWIIAYKPDGVEVARIVRDMHSITARLPNKVTVVIELKWTCSQAGSYSAVVAARNVPTW